MTAWQRSDPRRDSLSRIAILLAGLALTVALGASPWRDTAGDVDLSKYNYTLNGDGRLFLMQGDGLPDLYLFGTLQLSDPRVRQLPPTVEDAFDQAQVFAYAFQAPAPRDSDASAAQDEELRNWRNLCLLRWDQSLKGTVGSGLFDELRAVFAASGFAGVSDAELDRLSPWCAAIPLMMPASEWKRLATGDRRLDADLYFKALTFGKTLRPLASFAELFAGVRSTPMECQVELLRASLDAFGYSTIEAAWETWIQAYLDGDVAFPEPKWPQSAQCRNYDLRSIIASNRQLVRHLLEELDDRNTFVALSAYQIPGEEGIVNLLAREGYSVTVLEPPP